MLDSFLVLRFPPVLTSLQDWFPRWIHVLVEVSEDGSFIGAPGSVTSFDGLIPGSVCLLAHPN